MALQPLLSLIDKQPLPTKQDLVAVGINTAKKDKLDDSQEILMWKRVLHESVCFMNVDAIVQCHGTRASETDHCE